MQGTVRSFDPATRAAEVVLDDGTVVALVPGGLDPAVRALRPGQRLALAGLEGGTAARATLPGLS